tara:strand:+ start:151 stop:765 length:615 start_codon:yes stop_codon:yes gene_type:complete
MGLISNGTTIFDAGALDSGLAKGAMTLIKTLTASSSATLSFINGSSGVVLDGTYKEYIFYFNNIHPSVNDALLQFNLTTDGTNFNVTKTTTFFLSNHNEEDNTTGLAYFATRDLGQSTDDQRIMWELQNDNDDAGAGIMHLFEPSSTTFLKHFIVTTQYKSNPNYSNNLFVAGYGNTTSAITGVRFKLTSGNIDAGTISLYGIN